MNKITTLMLLLTASAALMLAGHSQDGIPGDEILAKIRQKAEITYKKYSGSESVRHIVNREYDSETGKLLSQYEVTVIRKEYFHKRPEYTTLHYMKNGKELPPAEYNYRTRDPVYLPFDPTVGAQYEYLVQGISMVAGKKCYEISVIPRAKTARHFTGKLYFTVDGLDLCYINGTVAKLPFFVKSLWLDSYFKKLGDESVISHGTFTINVDIPLFYPHRKIVSTFTSTNEKLLPAGD